MFKFQNVAYILGYTLFYHGIYYCPVMEKKFNLLIKFFHNIK